MKKLVDISVWILFIAGCLMLIFGIIASVRIGGPAVRSSLLGAILGHRFIFNFPIGCCRLV